MLSKILVLSVVIGVCIAATVEIPKPEEVKQPLPIVHEDLKTAETIGRQFHYPSFGGYGGYGHYPGGFGGYGGYGGAWGGHGHHHGGGYGGYGGYAHGGFAHGGGYGHHG